jgi:hypothetical protein
MEQHTSALRTAASLFQDVKDPKLTHFFWTLELHVCNVMQSIN